MLLELQWWMKSSLAEIVDIVVFCRHPFFLPQGFLPPTKTPPTAIATPPTISIEAVVNGKRTILLAGATTDDHEMLINFLAAYPSPHPKSLGGAE